jgi:hypothetical protein
MRETVRMDFETFFEKTILHVIMLGSLFCTYSITVSLLIIIYNFCFVIIGLKLGGNIHGHLERCVCVCVPVYVKFF